MKKRIICILIAAAAVTLAACTSGGESNSDPASVPSVESSSQESASAEAESSMEESEMSEEVKLEKEPIPEGAELITNLNYRNGNNKMGDKDGPAVCVYAPSGYNKGTLDVAISKMNINTVRKSDGKFLNAYIFLGIDVLSGPNGAWINCFDSGLCWSGKNGGWHLFYNVYANTDESEPTWYESSVRLDSTHDYSIVLDSSEKDGYATISIVDTTDGKTADSKSFTVKGLKCDGSNTAYYQDYALDFPNDVIVEEDGTVGSTYDKADWVKSTLYSTDENVYMQNILITDAKLYKGDEAKQWTEGDWGVWPDASFTDIDYGCTVIVKGENYYSYRIDLDMNR